MTFEEFKSEIMKRKDLWPFIFAIGLRVAYDLAHEILKKLKDPH